MRSLGIFLSHYSANAREARQLKELVHSVFDRQHQIFLSSDLRPGDLWVEELNSFLRTADITIVLASKQALERPWIWFEVGASWSCGATIIPLCIKGMATSSLMEPLSQLHALEGTLMGMQRLIDFIAQRCGIVVESRAVKQAIRIYFPHVV
jgi:hypothetical protein